MNSDSGEILFKNQEMKKLPVIVVCLFTLLVSSEFAQAQVKFPPVDKSVTDISYFPRRGGDKVVKVVYGRPNKNGREIFGKLVKYDKVWRTGANEATEITFYKDVIIGGKPLKAGTYTLFSIPNKGEWIIIFNAKLHQWGSYMYSKKQDVLRKTAAVEVLEKPVESFAITFDKTNTGADLVLGWDKTLVRLPITFE